jgi:ATP-dependent Clp protease ATP-binding subunit ClpB
VVLFDEIEKAHPDVFNALLQILDDGRLTDNQGRTVDFKNTVIIMTSNIASPMIMESVTVSGEIVPDIRDRIMSELRRAFRPEFLNRVDEIVLFTPLTEREIEQIVEIQVQHVAERLQERDIRLTLKSEARELIARRGYDPVYGARPLKRVIQKLLETNLAKLVVSCDALPGDEIEVGVANGELDFGIAHRAVSDETKEESVMSECVAE